MKDCWGMAFVLFLSLGACSTETPNVTATFNQAASLSGNLPANPLQWKIITSVLDTNDSTMSTLYGNDVAVQYTRTHAEHDYPDGSTLALVTWAQIDDPRWFGAKIPSQVKSVEFVSVRGADGDKTPYAYVKYEGSPLKMATLQEGLKPNERTEFLLSQRAAVMP
jgi:hypothetical protein